MSEEFKDLGFEPEEQDDDQSFDDLGFEDEVQDSIPMGGEMGLSDVIEQAKYDVPVSEGLPDVPEISQGQAASLGAQQGLTMGFSDEIGAGAQSTADRLQRMLNEYTGLVGKSPTQIDEDLASQGATGDIGPTNAGEMYDEEVANQRNKLNAAEAQHPWTYGAADLAGSIAIPVPGAAAARTAAKVLPKAMKATKGLSKVKKGMAAGIAAGGVEAAGRTEEDLLSAQGLIDVATGASLGAAGGAIAGKISQKMEPGQMAKKSKELMETADEQAMRSMGAGKKEIKEGLEARYKYDSPKDSGIMALEEGLVDPLSQPKIQYKNVLDKKKEIQQGYDAAIAKFDNRINLSENQAADLSKKYYTRIKDQVTETIQGNDQIPPEMRQRFLDETADLQDEILTALDSSNPIRDL